MTKQLKSFTILETLIGLMVFSIVISTTYAFFTLFNKQLLLYSKENTQSTAYNLFHNTMLNDISQSNTYAANGNALVLRCYDDTEIVYSTIKTGILRTTERATDTFKITSRQFSIIKDDVHTERLQLDIELFNEIVTLQYYLNNSPANAINTRYFK